MWRRAVNIKMPSPRGLPLVGTTLALIAAGSAPKVHEYIDMRHKQLGPVFRDTIGTVDAVFVANADEMRRLFSLEGKYPTHVLPEPWVLYNQMFGCKRGLFFMDGEEWLSVRRVMNKLLLKNDAMQSITPACHKVATDLVTRWKTCSGRELHNLEGQLYRWSLDVLLAVLLGAQYEVQRHQLEPAVHQLSLVVHRVFEESAKLSLIPARLAAKLHLSVWTNFVQTVDQALDGANRLVRQVVPLCEHGEGLLGRMLQEGIELPDVIRIVADLILAAGDTTAYSTEWAMYLLARNPKAQEELLKEVKETNSPEETIQLPLLRGVLREALRLYPVAPFLTRFLPQDAHIAGYPVDTGTLVILSLYTSGRDADYFPEPTLFWPQRWLRNDSGVYTAVKSPYASMPFAMGARSCIGRKIAETQIMLTLAQMVKNFKMELVNQEPIEMILRMVSVPSRPIRIWLTDR
ncbi:cytochrome P450 315a1, mitochondrial [Anabrus simplex]|uniref:cytochrome P450 315a1, mitochondrial n=1 Tax=Anabrus simplex TaxID=316456 RepID=UPI0035A3CF0C